MLNNFAYSLTLVEERAALSALGFLACLPSALAWLPLQDYSLRREQAGSTMLLTATSSWRGTSGMYVHSKYYTVRNAVVSGSILAKGERRIHFSAGLFRILVSRLTIRRLFKQSESRSRLSALLGSKRAEFGVYLGADILTTKKLYES